MAHGLFSAAAFPRPPPATASVWPLALKPHLVFLFQVLSFHALRLVALRRGCRNKKKTQQKIREKCLLAAPARVHSAQASLFLLLDNRLQYRPSPLCGLASWSLLGASRMLPGEKFLTWTDNNGPFRRSGIESQLLRWFVHCTGSECGSAENSRHCMSYRGTFPTD